jgi:tetratricopeptide (TPR) repeat protein
MLNLDAFALRSAIEDLETVISMDSTHLQANLLTAYCFYLLDNYDESIERFNKCQALGDTSLFLSKNLGFAYYYSGDNENSMVYLSRAFDKDTTNNNVLFALATVNKKLNNYPESIRLYSKLTERMHPYKEAMYIYHKKLAETYNDNGDYMNAVANYKEALNYAASTKNIELLFNISDIYDVYLKDYNSSLDYYNQYRKSLTDYRQHLTEEDSIEITYIQNKIENLDEHIKYIEYQIKKKTTR